MQMSHLQGPGRFQPEPFSRAELFANICKKHAKDSSIVLDSGHEDIRLQKGVFFIRAQSKTQLPQEGGPAS